MRQVDFETAIADFLAMGQRLQAEGPLNGERALEALATWYQETRVEGAALDEDADMLLLQWGATRPLVLSGPADLREVGDTDLRFVERDLQYLDFTRQVFAAVDDEEAFDDAAVQMSITLGFSPADGSEPGANRWIATPGDLEAARREFLGVPFVKERIALPARVIAISVGPCG